MILVIQYFYICLSLWGFALHYRELEEVPIPACTLFLQESQNDALERSKGLLEDLNLWPLGSTICWPFSHGSTKFEDRSAYSIVPQPSRWWAYTILNPSFGGISQMVSDFHDCLPIFKDFTFLLQVFNWKSETTFFLVFLPAPNMLPAQFFFAGFGIQP